MKVIQRARPRHPMSYEEYDVEHERRDPHRDEEQQPGIDLAVVSVRRQGHVIIILVEVTTEHAGNRVVVAEREVVVVRERRRSFGGEERGVMRCGRRVRGGAPNEEAVLPRSAAALT